jgi:hypothetical protein
MARKATEFMAVTKEQADFVRTRIAPLIDWRAAETTLGDLLANAYLWGLEDATEFLSARPVKP